MTIGEVVERLIGLKDSHDDLLSSEYQAVIAACNVLEKLPGQEEVDGYEPVKN